METLETQIEHHLNHLCVEIGPRPTGSPANRTAAAYVERAFEAAGLAVERQPFPGTDWEQLGTRLVAGGEQLPAAANTFSPPCEVSAPAVAVGTLAELEIAELTGRVGLLYGDLVKEPLAPKSWFLKSERDERIVQLLEEKAPAALITVQALDRGVVRLIEDAEFGIPSATVPAEVGLALLKAGNPTVCLTIESRREPGQTWNVLARTPSPAETRIVLCAHYDTTVDTPGACDNGTGVAILLALAQVLGGRQLPVGLEWVAFTGHEYLPLGDDEYVRRCGDEGFALMLAAINFDGVGPYLRPTTITTVSASPSFHDQVVGLTTDHPSVVWVDPWPQSNHSTFAWRGVPSIAFSSVGMARWSHRPIDTVERVSLTRVSEVVSLTAAIVESLQDRTPDWARETAARP